jgi:hypothetical protein
MPWQELILDINKEVRIKIGYISTKSRRRRAIREVPTFMKRPEDDFLAMMRMAWDMTYTKLLSGN